MSKPLFVIQEHHARHMHYDFHLEIDGVLKSWAVPKTPTAEPDIKRLTVLTEDHNLEYAKFQGTIEKGYSAGTVKIWDHGRYDNISHYEGKCISMGQAFEKGHIKINLHGKKLKGAFALIRFHNNDKNWLLMKIDDAYVQ